MLWKNEKKIHGLVNDYMAESLNCLETFRECLFELFEHSTSERARILVQQVDAAESRADDVRNAIEFQLYSKALLPEARGDILGLLEAVDRVPNWAEEVVYDIHLQRVVFPQQSVAKFQRLADMNVACFRVLHTAIETLFSDLDAVFPLTKEVDRIESEVDDLERELIAEIFDLEERLSYHNLLHRIIRGICDISDRAENVADRLAIVAMKKMI